MDQDVSASIINTIAEFLAGSNALGTLASLHLANHAIRDATLPILYETVLMDDVERLEYYKDGLVNVPKGFQNTKFLICVDISEGDVRATLPKFPSLLAAIVLDRQVDGMSDHPCDIYIHKPVRARTLFHDILRTPVHHVSRDHRKCTAPHKKEERYNFLCLKEEAKPRVRPCAIIQRVFLDADACLLPHPTADDWTTEIRLSNTAFIPRLNANKGSKAILNTLFEILRLAGRQADPAFLRELEEMQIRDLDWPMTACRHRAVYTPHHIRFEVTKKGWDQFEKRFASEVITHPEILLNRILITLRADMPFNDLRPMLNTFKTIYSRHATSYKLLLPGTGWPHELVTLALNTDTSGASPTTHKKGAAKWALRMEGFEPEMRYFVERATGPSHEMEGQVFTFDDGGFDAWIASRGDF